MTEKTCSPREHLIRAGQRLPGIWNEIEKSRSGCVFPPGVYIDAPTTGTAFVNAGRMMAPDDRDEFIDRVKALNANELIEVMMPFATLGTWRMTQGIYRFDPALYAPLISTPLTGDFPTEILMRLPEWCVYIETPGLVFSSRTGSTHSLLGVWARLEKEQDSLFFSLVIGLDIAGSKLIRHHYIPMVGSLSAAIDICLKNSKEEDPVAKKTITSYIEPIINLLLYLCADGAEIDGKHGQPGNPLPRKTRRDGVKLFAADGPATWDVGVRMGAALRRAYHAAELSQGGENAGPRPHIRRAHWHGFRSGPRLRKDGTEIPAAMRKFDLRWLPPIAVNLDDPSELPTTIRPVKP